MVGGYSRDKVPVSPEGALGSQLQIVAGSGGRFRGRGDLIPPITVGTWERWSVYCWKAVLDSARVVSTRVDLY